MLISSLSGAKISMDVGALKHQPHTSIGENQFGSRASACHLDISKQKVHLWSILWVYGCNRHQIYIMLDRIRAKSVQDLASRATFSALSNRPFLQYSRAIWFHTLTAGCPSFNKSMISSTALISSSSRGTEMISWPLISMSTVRPAGGSGRSVGLAVSMSDGLMCNGLQEVADYEECIN